MLYCSKCDTFACCIFFWLTLCIVNGLVTESPLNITLTPEPGTEEYNRKYNKSVEKVDEVMVADSPPSTTIIPDVSSDAEKPRRKKKDRNKNKNRQSRKDDVCGERSELDLKEMLGPAFNGRYMSVEKPVEVETDVEETTDSEEKMADESRARSVRVVPFHVHAEYSRELPHDFYLDISWYQEIIHTLSGSAARFMRYIRNVAIEGSELPWKCESEIVWTDLGANYYPRFLRNVQCTRENCWFGHFKCRPKAFTVNVLKRARDSCKDGGEGQEWIYEERAVTFCCECVEY